MKVVAVAAADLARVRSTSLREGRPHEGFAEDDDPSTVHLAAVDGSGAVVGVASFIDRGDGEWQLRGMGVEPSLHGGGVGRAVLEEGVRRLRAAGGRLLWANGRDAALGFYERCGFAVVGDGYDLQGVPHHRIELRLEPPGR